MSEIIMSHNTRNLTLCGLFSALIAIGAFIKIPVPVVPFTLQFLFTTLAGLLLGPRLGMISVGSYIAIGLVGLPVFTTGGGIGYILQPTFGYLVGFCFGAYATGVIAASSCRPSLRRLLVANLVGLLLVYLVGMIYYYAITLLYIKEPVGIVSLLLYGFLLPLPGDLAICYFGALFGKRLIPVLQKGVR